MSLWATCSEELSGIPKSLQVSSTKPEMMQSIEMNVLEEMAIEKVLAEAKINDQSQAYDDAIKPDPEPDFNEL